MSTIEQAVYEKLISTAGVTALVKARIFPVQAPEDIKRPFIVFTRISGERIKNLGGPSFVAQPRLQFDCYADTYEAAKAIAEQLRLALDGWSDAAAAVAIKGSSLITDREFWESEVDPRLYRISMDFLITHDETDS